jgi:hypothetical protein
VTPADFADLRAADRERIAEWLEACARGAETGARLGVSPPPAWAVLRQCALGVRRGAGIPDGPEYDAYIAALEVTP